MHLGVGPPNAFFKPLNGQKSQMTFKKHPHHKGVFFKCLLVCLQTGHDR